MVGIFRGEKLRNRLLLSLSILVILVKFKELDRVLTSSYIDYQVV